MADITIDKLVSGFGRMANDIRAGLLRKAGIAAGLEIRNEARQRAPRKTSTLVRSIDQDVKKATATEVEIEIGPQVNYGKWIEQGTGLYGPEKKKIVIVPRRARALRWLNAQGVPVFARRVESPGMKPRPYLAPAFDARNEDAAQTAMVVIWAGVERAIPG